MQRNNFSVGAKHFLAAMAFLAIAQFTFAEVPALSSSQNPKVKTSTGETPFERLFTTPQERRALDYARKHGGVRPQVSGIDENLAVQATTQTPQPIKLLGVLLRADGKNKVWLNGVSEGTQNTINNHAIGGNMLNSANVKVPLRGSNTGAILKPGQVWNSAKNRVEESYQIPVPKPVAIEPAIVPKAVKVASSAASTNSSTQASSVNNSEVHSSVPSSAK